MARNTLNLLALPDDDPGPKGTPEIRRRARAEGAALLAKIGNWNTPRAAAYIRENPPSPEAIAHLAYLYISQQNSRNAKGLRRPDINRAKLDELKAVWIKSKGRERGWKSFAASELETSIREINKRL